jgi:exodeoxyribonuclease-5
MTLTTEQQKAHDTVLDWAKTSQKCLTFGGYGGTGKSTTLAQIALTLKSQGKRLAFATVSGKASSVLRQKMVGVLTNQDYCGTIHSLVYRLIGKERLKSGRTELHFEVDTEKHLPFDLLVIDEASMVNEWMFRDLAQYGIPILAVGDHAQLPPIKGTFNLMAKPEIRLEKIMRQAEGNPIIKMATMAREEGVIKYGDYGQGCVKTCNIKVLHEHQYSNLNSIMLCAINKTRVKMNAFAREKLSLAGDPHIGEPLICLYNNNKKLIFNGNIGMLKSLEVVPVENNLTAYDVTINFGDFIFQNNIDPLQFGKQYISIDEKDANLDYFDYGYCITTHRAQGSEWNNVLVIEEGDFLFKDDLWRRWLYTAVSRSKERLIIFKR